MYIFIGMALKMQSCFLTIFLKSKASGWSQNTAFVHYSKRVCVKSHQNSSLTLAEGDEKI
jgi:hypothetical protein